MMFHNPYERRVFTHCQNCGAAMSAGKCDAGCTPTPAHPGPSYVFWCINKRCRKYHVRVPGMGPREYRAATGREQTCSWCDRALYLTEVSKCDSNGNRCGTLRVEE